MNARQFTKSGAGAEPINTPEDCLYTTPQNCANPSSNMKLIYSHSLARPTLNHFFVFGHFIGVYRRVEISVYFVNLWFLFIIFVIWNRKHNNCIRPVIR